MCSSPCCRTRCSIFQEVHVEFNMKNLSTGWKLGSFEFVEQPPYSPDLGFSEYLKNNYMEKYFLPTIT